MLVYNLTYNAVLNLIMTTVREEYLSTALSRQYNLTRKLKDLFGQNTVNITAGTTSLQVWYPIHSFIITYEDFIYPSILVQTSEQSFISIKGNKLRIHLDTFIGRARHATTSAYEIDIDQFCEEELFNINLITTTRLDIANINTMISEYKKLKDTGLNVLIELREGR